MGGSEIKHAPAVARATPVLSVLFLFHAWKIWLHIKKYVFLEAKKPCPEP